MNNDEQIQKQYEENVKNEGMSFLNPNRIPLFRCEVCGKEKLGLIKVGDRFWCNSCLDQL